MLSISIVIYHLDKALFVKSLQSLYSAIGNLPFDSTRISITIIDNGNQQQKLEAIIAEFKDRLSPINILSGIRNIGYGRAHNLAILASDHEYHLILNPDVILHENSLLEGLGYLEKHTEVSGVAPFATDDKGQTQYLCKEYPSVTDLLIRGFAPRAIKRKYSRRLHAYENRSLVEASRPAKVTLISGCFMLCKTRALKDIGGFDEAYFLYFEDFALSMELNKRGNLHYLPAMEIVHYGGNAARKGLWHIYLFVSSGIRFFNCYGWKFQ